MTFIFYLTDSHRTVIISELIFLHSPLYEPQIMHITDPKIDHDLGRVRLVVL